MFDDDVHLLCGGNEVVCEISGGSRVHIVCKVDGVLADIGFGSGHLLTCDKSSEVCNIWGDSQRNLVQVASTVCCVNIGLSGKYAAFGCIDGLCGLINLKTLKQTWSIKHSLDTISAIALNGNDKCMATCCVSGKIFLTNLELQRLSAVLESSSMQAMKTVKFNPTSKPWLCTASDDGRLQLWDVSKTRGKLSKNFDHHSAPLTDFVFAPWQEALVMSVGLDCVLALLDLKKQTVVKSTKLPCPLTCITAIGNSHRVAVGTDTGAVYILNLQESFRKFVTIQVLENRGTLRRLFWTPNQFLKFSDVLTPPTATSACAKVNNRNEATQRADGKENVYANNSATASVPTPYKGLFSPVDVAMFKHMQNQFQTPVESGQGQSLFEEPASDRFVTSRKERGQFSALQERQTFSQQQLSFFSPIGTDLAYSSNAKSLIRNSTTLQTLPEDSPYECSTKDVLPRKPTALENIICPTQPNNLDAGFETPPIVNAGIGESEQSFIGIHQSAATYCDTPLSHFTSNNLPASCNLVGSGGDSTTVTKISAATLSSRKTVTFCDESSTCSRQQQRGEDYSNANSSSLKQHVFGDLSSPVVDAEVPTTTTTTTATSDQETSSETCFPASLVDEMLRRQAAQFQNILRQQTAEFQDALRKMSNEQTKFQEHVVDEFRQVHRRFEGAFVNIVELHSSLLLDNREQEATFEAIIEKHFREKEELLDENEQLKQELERLRGFALPPRFTDLYRNSRLT